MNSTDSSSPRPAWWCRLLKGYAVAMGLSALVLGLALCDALTLSSDASVLRDVISSKSGAHLSTRVQLSATAPLLVLARGCLHYVDNVPSEARVALASVKRASVGVYTLNKPLSGDAAVAVLTATGNAMTKRGWTRAVGVLDGKQCVSIFLRPSCWSDNTQDVCVSVCNGDEVVVVSGRADAAALAQLVHDRVGAVRL